jgi:hypothetical protein
VRQLVPELSELRGFLVIWCRSYYGAFSQLRLRSQNDKKCDNFVELELVTNNGNIEFVEITHNMNSYLSQWRSKLDNWGWAIFIYSCSASLITFEINCF